MILLFDISAWWSTLSSFESIYWLIAIPFTLVFILIMLMTFIGGDMDSDTPDADLDIDSDGGIDFQFFTLKNLVAFFCIFAWAGLSVIDAGLGKMATISISTICGLIMMAIMSSIFYFMGKLTQSGTLNINNAKGKMGEVYLTIPANREGFGKVQITIQNSLRTLEALTDSNESISTGTAIKVVEVIDNHKLIVEKLNA